MKISKSLRKIIVYKTMNRRLSSILKLMASDGREVYTNFYCGSRWNNYTKQQLLEQMQYNSNRILFIRSKMLEVKRGA